VADEVATRLAVAALVLREYRRPRNSKCSSFTAGNCTNSSVLFFYSEPKERTVMSDSRGTPVTSGCWRHRLISFWRQ
jgi:hypothetical protein